MNENKIDFLMLLISRLLILLYLSMLISCRIALPAGQQVKHLDALPNMEHSVKDNLKNTRAFSQGDWPDKAWWRVYDSSELNDLIAQALALNPSIQEMNSRIHVARQETIIAKSVLYPLVFFDAIETKQYTSQHGLYRALNSNFPLSAYLVDLSLSFNYEFDFWGQNHNLLYEAIGRERVMQAEAAQVELMTTTALAQAYFAYKTNVMRKELYEQLVMVRMELTQLNSLLLYKGLSSALEPFQSTENASEAKKLLANINEELAVDKHLINILAGRGPDAPLGIDKKRPALPSRLVIPKTLSLDLVARRPDLMAQIWRAKALAYKTGAAMADFYPNVNLIGLIGLESTSWKTLFATTSGTSAIKPAFNLPIFTAGAIRANINAIRAQFDAAIFAYNNLLLQSTQEVLDVLAFAKSIEQQNQEQATILDSAEKRFNLVLLRQKGGLDSRFDTYYLQEEVIQAKLTKVLLLYNQYLASIKLTKALGGGYVQANVPLVNRCGSPLKCNVSDNLR